MAADERVLLVGGGAREHALALALRRSPMLETLIAAPGNAGIFDAARCVPVRTDDVPALCDLAVRERVTLVVIGPELPLCAGLADALRARGIAVFGPGAAGARLEGSKAFAKEFMRRNGVPTAAFQTFDDPAEADRYVREAGRPLVVKADGLAAGKGVVVASDAAEAMDAIDAMMRRRVFGDAGRTVVIEERLTGEEISFHAVTDGHRVVLLGGAQDHKRVGDGDVGPNTGGMGAYSPVPALDRALEARIIGEIVTPTIRGLATDGIEFRGTLFFGVMLDGDAPMLLEYNVRFGDPECAVLLARLEGDVLPLLRAAARGDLSGVDVRMRDDAAIAVVMASQGYPTDPRLGDAIDGLEAAATLADVAVLHAGTRRDGARVLTAGGRVLTVTATGRDIDDAAARAYAAVDRIHFDGAHVRRDIGWRARR